MNRTVALGLIAVLVWAPAPRAPAQAVPEQPASNASGDTLPAAPLLPQKLELAEPMSRRMLFVRYDLGGMHIERNGEFLLSTRYAAGLDRIVAGSPTAAEFAHQAHGQLVTGAALLWTGLGLDLAGLVGGLALEASNPGNSSNVSTGTKVGAGVCLGALLVGLVVALVGVPFTAAGLRNEFDAVNAYNADLVDGRLDRAR